MPITNLSGAPSRHHLLGPHAPAEGLNKHDEKLHQYNPTPWKERSPRDNKRKQMSIPQIRVLRFLNSLPFADLVLKPTAINGTEPKDTTDNAFTVKASGVEIGFWQSPGSFKTARKGTNEVTLVLEGRATLVSATGERVDHKAGDMFLIPDGWSGVREIHEHFNKQYISICT